MELIDALEANNISEYEIKVPDSEKKHMRLLQQTKDKILKYDSFLARNRDELS